MAINTYHRTCFYCDAKAIGYEREYGTQLNTNVCEGCAHVNATVHLYEGGTCRMSTSEALKAQGSKDRLATKAQFAQELLSGKIVLGEYSIHTE